MSSVSHVRPNILLIHSDQHRCDCLGVNGHALVQTPHLDRLALEGMNFRNAFTPVPVCVPSRNSLLHGCWPTRHLCIANHDTEAPRGPADLPHFSGVLRDCGYFLGMVGKWHTCRDRGPDAFGFDAYVPVSGYAAWREAEGLPPRPFGTLPFVAVDTGVEVEQTRAHWGANQAIGMLRRASESGRPFFVRWDPSEPHLPNLLPEPYASLVDPSEVRPWAGFGDTFEGKPYIQRQQLRTWGVSDWTWSEWAPLVAAYLSEISLLDHEIGRVLGVLDALGLRENTLVVYSADHGDMCGSHGMVDKHYVMYDDVMRVPLIVRWPQRVTGGCTCEDFVVHGIDLARTFCEVAGGAVPDTFQGISLLPLLEGGGRSAGGRPDVYGMYHGNQMGLYSQRMVRDTQWKYVWNATAEDELYALSTDPGERVNRVEDVACADELARLRRRMVDWMAATEDPLLNQWSRRQLLGNRSGD